MKKVIPFCLALLIVTTIPHRLVAKEPPHQILGLGLNMTEEEAHKRLKEMGEFVRNDAGWQEIWQVRDPSFAHLIIGLGKDGKLNYVTAVAREDKEAKRISYDEIGNVKQARQAGDVAIKNFNYQWDVPAQAGNPHMLVIVAGRDSKFLATHSLKNLDNVPAKKE